MTQTELKEKLDYLKMDYVRLQGDVEKLESIGGNADAAIKQMEEIEEEIRLVNQRLRA
ncbi:SE1832 family protein [Alteribacillus sp. HJP-4]|uniref:SE1832 family protein n=1 Tax=Alteribacillus sp. HJP-4 TaxID=2775394 RepID=UPI0035CD264F